MNVNMNVNLNKNMNMNDDDFFAILSNVFPFFSGQLILVLLLPKSWEVTTPD